MHAGLLDVFLDPTGRIICRTQGERIRKEVQEAERKRVAASLAAAAPMEEPARTPVDGNAQADGPARTPADEAPRTPVGPIDPRTLFDEDTLEGLEEELIAFGSTARRARLKVRRALKKIAAGEAPPTRLGLWREAYGLPLEEIPGDRRSGQGRP